MTPPLQLPPDVGDHQHALRVAFKATPVEHVPIKGNRVYGGIILNLKRYSS